MADVYIPIAVQLRGFDGADGAGTRRWIKTSATGVLGVQDDGGSLTVDAPAGTPVAVRPSDGAAFQTLHEADFDSGVGTQNRIAVGLLVPASGGGVIITGDAGNGLDVDVTRVSGTVTVDSELPAAAALADNTANPTVPGVGSFPHLFDGVTWDRMPGNSAGGVYCQGPGAAGAAPVGNPVYIAGTDGTNLRALKTDAAGELQVDVLSGGGEPTPTTPVIDRQNSTDTAAGAAATFNTAELTGTSWLWGVDLAASVPWKAVIAEVENAVVTNRVTLFGKAMETVQWRNPHRKFIEITLSAGADNFRVVMTNMDNAQAADLHATFFYSQ